MTLRPINQGCRDWSLQCWLTSPALAFSSSKWDRSQCDNFWACCMESVTKYGTLWILRFMTRVETPPHLVMALAPLDVEATIAPSVVAIGHRIISLCTWSPLMSKGPAIPWGILASPIGFSMFPLRFSVVYPWDSLGFHHCPTFDRDAEVTCSTHSLLLSQSSRR